jgi:S-phase kinase-associated protein 1
METTKDFGSACNAEFKPKIYIKIIPSDVDESEAISVEKDLLIQSLTLKNMIEDIGDDEGFAIPLSNVRSSVFEKIVEYLTYRRDHPIYSSSSSEDIEVPEKITPTTDKKDEKLRKLEEWEKEYCPKNYSDLFELILSVNYLDIKELMVVLCRIVADRITGLTAEEIRVVFNIKNDFTPEEEEKIIKENDWVEKE